MLKSFFARIVQGDIIFCYFGLLLRFLYLEPIDDALGECVLFTFIRLMVWLILFENIIVKFIIVFMRRVIDLSIVSKHALYQGTLHRLLLV